jgi:peptidoglycan/xylan/chitin deacetylase (PgdA/CDA1 family)
MRGILTLIRAGKPRPIIKWLWIYLLFLSGSLRRAKRWLANQNAIVVLMFHRVLPQCDAGTTHSLPAMVVQDRTFDAFSHYVSDNHTVIGFEDLQNVWRATGQSKGIRVACTFDDGWTDNATFAAPIALRHGIPLVIFVCPAKVGTHLPFWPERLAVILELMRSRQAAVKQLEGILTARVGVGGSQPVLLSRRDAIGPVVELLKSHSAPERDEMMQRIVDAVTAQTSISEIGLADSTMNWDEIKRLRAMGVTIGSHTDSHQILTTVPLPDARREVTDSKIEIERILGSECALFAYPNGGYSAAVRNTVAEAGYKFAFTTEHGAWTEDCDPLLIPRINMWEGKLAGPSGEFSSLLFEYATFWKAYRARRRRPKAVAAPPEMMDANIGAQHSAAPEESKLSV